MPVKIISKEEIFTEEIEGSKFQYRFITETEYNQISNKYSDKGKIKDSDWLLINLDILKSALVGWDNIENGSGKNIPFSLERIDGLPVGVQTILSSKILSGITERGKKLEKEAKNSKTTSSNKKH